MGSWVPTTTSATLPAAEEQAVSILVNPGQEEITWGFFHGLDATENRLVAVQGSTAVNLLLLFLLFFFPLPHIHCSQTFYCTCQQSLFSDPPNSVFLINSFANLLQQMTRLYMSPFMQRSSWLHTS